ncbi:cholesterol esterase [Lobosporangium transversale]|nr:cholesterol esterase [Lobosporangium transversale]
MSRLFPWIVTNYISSKAPPLESAANVQEMLRFWNYPVQEHLVRTQDNYLLGIHRITHGREQISAKGVVPDPPEDIVKFLKKHGVPLAAETKEAHLERSKRSRRDQEENLEADLDTHPRRKSKKNDYIKPVVLLYHGFMMCSEVWLCNLDEERNLAFVLAEAGYDVWLGNARGNKYSLKHMFLKPHENKFWEFGMDELAMFDMPDTVDYILARTGAPSLVYIGFSQGTAQAFASLSINPSLNDKISLFIALAPATTPPGLDNGLVNSIVKAAPNVIYLLFGRKTPLTAALFWQNLLHPTAYAVVIDWAVKFLFGWNCTSMSRVQKAVSYQHLYSFTSVRILVHWFQIIRTQVFQMYDDVLPRVPYLSSTRSHCPHPFPTNQITTPIAIFYGGSDTLVDVKALLSFNGHISSEEAKRQSIERMSSNGLNTYRREIRKLAYELEGLDSDIEQENEVYTDSTVDTPKEEEEQSLVSDESNDSTKKQQQQRRQPVDVQDQQQQQYGH